MECHIQIFLNGCWQTATLFEPDLTTLDQGVTGGCRLQYDIDYAVAHLGNQEAELVPGLTVGLELYWFKHWPPFIIDLLPGALAGQPGSNGCKLFMTICMSIGAYSQKEQGTLRAT